MVTLVYAGGPDCTKVKADVKSTITSYMTKYLGFSSGEGVKIDCPGGVESKSFEWEELMGKNAPNDVFTAEGKATTPNAAGGGYYEIYYRVSYTRWHDYSKNVLSDSWKFSWVTTTHYKAFNVPGEELTNEDKEKCFLDFIAVPEKRSKLSRIQDYVKVNDLKALAKVTNLSPEKKEIWLIISGEKIRDANDGNYFDYYPAATNEVQLTIVKQEGKWVATFGSDGKAENGKKYTILKPIKAKTLGVDGWDAVYQKMTLTEGTELSVMSENLANRLDDRMKDFAKMMNSLDISDKNAAIEKIKAYMSPSKAQDLAQKWYDLMSKETKCAIFVKQFNCSGEVKREDKGGVKAFYNFEYSRNPAKTEEEMALYKKCGVPEKDVKGYYSKRESGQIAVVFSDGEWYFAEFPVLKYNHDGTKR